MTQLGRIFTLLVLCLSLVFFIVSVIANSSHISHKQKITAYQAQVKVLETTVDQVKKYTEQLKTSLAQEQLSRKTALAELQTQLSTAREQLAQANTDLTGKTATLTIQTQKLAETIDRVASLNKLNDTLKDEINKIVMDRDDQRKRVISLQDNLNSLKSVEADLLAQKDQLMNAATLYQAQAETLGAALNRAGIKDVDDVPPADLKGVVLAIDGNQQVVVSLGRDDGLRVGHKLEVYRAGQYLGQIEIKTIKDDQAIGKILIRKGFIQKDDKVAARIN